MRGKKDRTEEGQNKFLCDSLLELTPAGLDLLQGGGTILSHLSTTAVINVKVHPAVKPNSTCIVSKFSLTDLHFYTAALYSQQTVKVVK